MINSSDCKAGDQVNEFLLCNINPLEFLRGNSVKAQRARNFADHFLDGNDGREVGGEDVRLALRLHEAQLFSQKIKLLLHLLFGFVRIRGLSLNFGPLMENDKKRSRECQRTEKGISSTEHVPELSLQGKISGVFAAGYQVARSDPVREEDEQNEAYEQNKVPPLRPFFAVIRSNFDHGKLRSFPLPFNKPLR